MNSLTRTGHFVIRNEKGLHARPAALFVQAASRYSSSISVQNEETRVSADGKSVMSMLMLAAPRGARILITACGEDAEDALRKLGDLVDRGFDE